MDIDAESSTHFNLWLMNNADIFFSIYKRMPAKSCSQIQKGTCLIGSPLGFYLDNVEAKAKSMILLSLE